jgi:hypothetical protein
MGEACRSRRLATQPAFQSGQPDSPRSYPCCHRDQKFHDLHFIELATGDNSLIEENDGVASFVTDHHYVAHLAVRHTPVGAREILHRPDGVWTPWITFAPEDALISHPSHLNLLAIFITKTVAHFIDGN